MLRCVFATLPISVAAILGSAAMARTIDTNTVYSDTCPEADVSCGEQLIVVDGVAPPTVLEFVEPARLLSGFFGSFGPSIRLMGLSVLNVAGGSILSVDDGGAPVVHASGQSRVSISGGDVRGTYSAVVAEDDTSVTVSGGLLSGDSERGTIWLRDNARGMISGGEVVRSDGHGVFATGNSELIITGGHHYNRGLSVSAIGARDNATVYVFGGTLEGGFSIRDQSVVHYFGGTISARPGMIGYLGESASANIHGGVFSSFDDDRPFEFYAEHNSSVNFFGSGFETVELYPGGFLLTGVLADGSPLKVLAQGNFVLHEIPEPSSIWLAALACLFHSFRRRQESPRRIEYLSENVVQSIVNSAVRPPAPGISGLGPSLIDPARRP